MKLLIVYVMIVACWAGTVSADLYKWVDENGVTHFSNVAPPTDQQAQTKVEVKGAAPINRSSPGIDRVINSYKRDALQYEIEETKKRLRRGPLNKNSSRLDLYERWIKRDKETIRIRREELKDVKRESYRDSKEHKIKVRYYENRVKDAELELEEDRRRLERAKSGK